MRAIKVYCPPGVEPPLYAFIDALDGKLKATQRKATPSVRPKKLTISIRMTWLMSLIRLQKMA